MKMTIGAKIQTLRKQRGMSQEQLAEALGVSRQAVSKWEAEQSVPDIDKIISICDYFGVTSDYILRNAELPKNDQQSEPIIERTYNISENKVDEENAEKQKESALLLGVAIMLYILCVVPVIIFQNVFGVVLMFVMIAVATGIIVYRSTLNRKNDEQAENKKNENPTLKAVNSCVWAVAVIIYFVISFLSSAWYITWLVFPITGAITDVIEACFDLKDGDNK